MHGPGRIRFFGNLVDGARVDHGTFLHDADGVAKILKFGKHVGGYQNGLSLGGEFAQEVAQVDSCLGIEVGGWFVEKKDFRFVNQSLGKQSSLLHSAGE